MVAKRPEHMQSEHMQGSSRGRGGVSPHSPHRRRSAHVRGGELSASRGGTAVFAIAVLAVALLCGGAAAWWLFLRPVDVSVNGREVQVQVGTTVSALLKDNGYFGVKPGRLLSVGGNVLSEDGGDKASVKRGGTGLSPSAFDSTKLEGGEQLTVENGKDATEPSKEEQVEVKPNVEMQPGGAIQYVSQWGKTGKKVVLKGEKSGETVDKQVIEESRDMVVASRNPKPAGGKYVALTFDDGPSRYTPQILQALKDKGAKATFFNLGNESKANPALTKQVVDSGNELGSHTNTHQNLPKLDRDALRSEITSAFDTLKSNAGLPGMQMMRAPYGAFTKVEWARSADLIGTNVIWNIDTLDWKRPGADAIRDAVVNKAYNGAIVLMHDGGGDRSQDVDALPQIIDGLRQKGFTLVTVSELMQLDGGFPEDVVKGSVQMPKDAVLPAL